MYKAATLRDFVIARMHVDEWHQIFQVRSCISNVLYLENRSIFAPFISVVAHMSQNAS